MSSLNDLQNRIQALEDINQQVLVRNKRVEADKAWETSWTRKLLIIIFTYLSISLYLQFIVGINPWINAVVPSLGFLLSTLTLPYFKELWIKKHRK